MSTGPSAYENELNAMIQKGEIMAAFEKFYADDVVMQENSDPPFAGKPTNREREQAFVDSVEQLHGIKLLNSAVNGDIAFCEWLFDLTFRGGHRAQLAQVSVRHWKDGKVVRERFYYNKG